MIGKPRFRLVDGWQVILKTSWAVKLAGAAAGLQTILTAIQLVPDGIVVSPLWGFLVAALTAAAGVARLILQERMRYALDADTTTKAVADQTKIETEKEKTDADQPDSPA